LAGGQGSLPLAGTAVYMTSYSRLTNNRKHEEAMAERPWLYQTPMDILIKASNGASDLEINWTTINYRFGFNFRTRRKIKKLDLVK
jgi:hypothetical protein